MTFLLAATLSLIALWVGAYPFGNANDADLCRVTQPFPQTAGPVTAEDVSVSAEHTWIPLGVACTFDLPEAGVGSQVTLHQSWPATWAWLAASAIALFSLALVVRHGARLFRRRGPLPGRAHRPGSST